MLRKIFGTKREDVAGEWRKLHKEELNDLYSSPHIIRVTNWRRIIWVGYVARMGTEVYTGFWWGNLRATEHFEDLGVNGSVILKWIFKEWYGDHGPD